MIIYADTSGLVKLLLEEGGSAVMLATAREATVLASTSIAYVELRAAIAAATRDGRIPSTARTQLAKLLEEVWAGVSEIPITGPLVRHAGNLAERWGLRGYDAVHLASLIALGDPASVSFACWDDRLRGAAEALGYNLTPLG